MAWLTNSYNPFGSFGMGAGGAGGDGGGGSLGAYYDAVAASYAKTEKDKLDYQYAALKQGARTAAEALAVDRWYKGKQIELAWAAQELARDRFEFDQEMGRYQQEIGRGRLGLDFLGQASQLRGPRDYFQYQDFMRGAGQVAGLPAWLNALTGTVQGQGLPRLGALGAVSPDQRGAERAAAADNPPGGEGVTMGSLLRDVQGKGGGAPGGGYSTENALRQIRRVGAGVQGLPYGSLERLGPSELGVLQSGLEHPEGGAYSFPDWMNAYLRRRPGQGRATAA